MTFLPIVERELRVAARRRGTYGTRMRIAGGATIIFALFFVFNQIVPSFPLGKSLFWYLSGLCMIYCLAAGRVMTADCLSREKREGTLGLLFLTDLRGYDVVLGKLVATSFNGFYGMMAVVPVLAFSLLAGGMTNGELWRMALVLINTFLFSLAVGLFVSAIYREQQSAMGANFGLLLVLTALGPAVAGMLVFSTTHARPLVHELFYTCPVYSFFLCEDTLYNASPGHFWWSIGITFDLTIMLVLLACRIAPRSWQDKPVSSRSLKRKRGERRRRWWREGRLEKANAFRRRLLDINGYYWLAARPYLKSSYVWTCMICMGIWWIFTTEMIGHPDEAANYAMAFLLNGMLKLWVTTEAGHQLAEDKRSGAFELLLSTPLTVRDILHGQWQALRLQFLKPLIAAVIVELALMVSIGHIRPVDSIEARWTWLAGILMLLADVFTIGWVAIWMALTSKSHGAATLKTTAWILSLPWILLGTVEAVTRTWIWLFTRHYWEPSWRFDLGWWFGIGLGVDSLLLFVALRRVQSSFRQIALESPAPKPLLAWLRELRTGRAGHKISHRAKLRRWAVAAAVVLAIMVGVVVYMIRAARLDLPKPVIASLSQTNQPVRVFPGSGGFFFILPDGSLWRWVHENGDNGMVFQPRQVGTNRDWVQARLNFPNAIGVRSNGTLWGWRVLEEEPTQVGSDSDWVQARVGSRAATALKQDGTMWAWGDPELLGNGAAKGRYLPINPSVRIPTGTNMMVQVGTNRDWKAISTSTYNGALVALRTDGTLWTWGGFTCYVRGTWAYTNYAVPIQLCRESNWISLGDRTWSGAQNQAGEWWSLFPFASFAGADVPVSELGWLATSNSATSAIGLAYHANWSFTAYGIQPDGTMWTSPIFSWPVLRPPNPQDRVGQRSDWVSVWGQNGTVIGLTSDNTLWTWGADFGQQRHYDFGDRVAIFKEAISNTFAARAGPSWNDEQGYQLQKTPRPLLRMIFTNSSANSPTSLAPK